ncbi:MAG: TonB-dependent receptor, partial [Bacteroidota bacterium]
MLLVIASHVVMAQKSSISGTITNPDGEAIELVNVSLEGTLKGAITDKQGKFTISNVNPGKYRLLISALGYASQKNQIEVQPGQNLTVDPVVLEIQEEELAEVTIFGRNGYTENSVSSSLRQITEISKLPQNIQIVNSNLLRDQQVTSIMEGVIRNVSGVTMLEHWGHFARVHMRGFRLPAFRNGFNVSDSWGPLSEDMSLVDRIEFVKGPSGFMLSAGEPGGFYNVATKKPTEQSIGQATLMAGSFDFYRASVDLGGKLTPNGKLLYRLNGMFQTSDSHRGDEDVQRFAIAPALTYKFSENTSLTAELNYQQAESSIGSAYVFAPVADGFGSLDRDFKNTDTNYPLTDITETAVFGIFNHKFSDNWKATLQYSHLNYDQVGNSAWISSLAENGDAFRSIFLWDAASIGNYAQGFVNGKATTGNVSHTILGGIDFTDKMYYADFFSSFVDSTAFNIFNPTYGREYNLNFDRSVDVKDRFDDPWNGFTSTAFYVQDEIGFWEDKVRLTLAGRYTMLETVGKEEQDNRFTPRVGLSVDLTPTMSVYGLYDQSFLAQAGASASGEQFDPVVADDIEGGIKKSFFNGRLRASLGAFLITKNNLLVGDPDNPMFSIQLGEVQSKGIEFDVQGEIAPGLSVVLNYAATDVEVTEDTNPDAVGSKVPGHARHMTNGWFTYNVPQGSGLSGFGASLGYQYQIDRSTWSWGADNQTDLPN